MDQPQLERILQTSITNDRSDVLLVAGLPPLLRTREHVRELAIPPLSASDIDSILKLMLGPTQFSDFLGNGRSYAHYTFRGTDVFRIQAFRLAASNFAVIAPANAGASAAMAS